MIFIINYRMVSGPALFGLARFYCSGKVKHSAHVDVWAECLKIETVRCNLSVSCMPSSPYKPLILHAKVLVLYLHFRFFVVGGPFSSLLEPLSPVTAAV